MDRKDRTIAKQILLTLGYTDQFMYPLRRSEMWQRLISLHGMAAERNRFQQVLSTLKLNHLVTQKDSLFSLPSKLISSESFVQTRRDRVVHSRKKQKEAHELVLFLRSIPWITGVLVTGSVAMNNATQDDDVDFLIITAPNSLWFVRPLVIGFSWLKKKRRSWKKEEKNSWCFNFWLEETQVSLPKKQRTIYTAYELLQAKWIFAEPSAFRMYYSSNLWAQRILPELFTQSRQKYQSTVIDSKETQSREDMRLYYYFPVMWANTLMYWAQLIYMLPHRTSERVAKSFAFFHPRDTHAQVYENWKQSLKRLVY